MELLLRHKVYYIVGISENNWHLHTTQEWCLQILSKFQTTVVARNTTQEQYLKYFQPPDNSFLVNSYPQGIYQFEVSATTWYTCNLGITIHYNSCGFEFIEHHSPMVAISVSLI